MSRRVVLVPVVVEESRPALPAIAVLAALALLLVIGAASRGSSPPPVGTSSVDTHRSATARWAPSQAAGGLVMGWDTRCVPAVAPPGLCSGMGGHR